MPGLARPKPLPRGEGPGIHVISRPGQKRGWPGHRRAKATPGYDENSGLNGSNDGAAYRDDGLLAEACASR
ncbi:hypothetical protein ACVWWI_000715 [Bradyrhizobium sp. USDA 3686]|nr:hypothetical protein [Bradyrhizobium canariense]